MSHPYYAVFPRYRSDDIGSRLGRNDSPTKELDDLYHTTKDGSRETDDEFNGDIGTRTGDGGDAGGGGMD